jgi:hypothetical protein
MNMVNLPSFIYLPLLSSRNIISSSQHFFTVLISSFLIACGGGGETPIPNEAIDSDNDGVIDSRDAFPNDPSESVDSDNDGIGDNSDHYPNDASRHTAPVIDTTPPVLEEVTPIGSVKNATPSYTFLSSEPGLITFRGDCESHTTQAQEGNNTIELMTLDSGTYDNCILFVTDIENNQSDELIISAFEITDYTEPTISVSSYIGTTHSLSSNITLISSEAGILSMLGSCETTSSALEEGENSIEVSVEKYGTYDDCKIAVTDAASNKSSEHTISRFHVTPEKVTVIVWRNDNGSIIDFPSDINGFIFESTPDKNCDTTNFSSCQDYQKTTLSGESIIDTSQTINDFEGWYKLSSGENGTSKSSIQLSDYNDPAPQLSGSADTSVISFNGEIFSLYGRNGPENWGSSYNDSFWKSTNGQDWKETPIDVPSRAAQTTNKFNNQLWTVHGHYKKLDNSNERLHRNDVYFSNDGISWTYASAGPTPVRAFHKSFVLNNKLWVIGGINYEDTYLQTSLSDIWSTSDGINWEKEADSSNLPWSAQQNGAYIVFSGYVWNFHEKIWRSQDGVTWNEVITNSQYSYDQWVPRPVVEYKGDLFMFGGGEANEIWTSSNGYNWTKHGTLPYIGEHANQSGTPVILNDEIYILEAGDGITLKSKDGNSWYRGYTGWFDFPPYN